MFMSGSWQRIVEIISTCNVGWFTTPTASVNLLLRSSILQSARTSSSFSREDRNFRGHDYLKTPVASPTGGASRTRCPARLRRPEHTGRAAEHDRALEG